MEGDRVGGFVEVGVGDVGLIVVIGGGEGVCDGGIGFNFIVFIVV